MDERNELPRGWTWITVGEVAQLLRGVSYNKQEASKEPRDGLVPILRANNINGELNFDSLVFVPQDRVKGEQFIKAFDILIAMSSGSKDLVGKAAQAKLGFVGGFGTFCGLVRSSSEIDKRFLGFYFQSPDYRYQISQLSSGVNINNLRREHIEAMPLALPPLSEQSRIVAKIEELFSDLDAGIAALKNAKAQLKRYRQAVLKAAVEGELTAEWRATHRGEIEPASALLERIRAERAKNANGKTKALPLSHAPELGELPEGWVWATVDEIGDTHEQTVLTGPFGANLGREDFVESGVTVLTIGCLTEYGITLDKAMYISHKKAEELAKYTVKAGDLLFSRMASVGRAEIVPNWLDGVIFNYHLMRLRLSDKTINPKYFISYVRGSRTVVDYIREVNHGATRDGINTKQLLGLPVRLPPLAEQEQIVAEVERRLSVAEEIEKTLDASLKQAEHLRQSILKRAFAGKLVPQDPNDEPAERLLERIRAARADYSMDSSVNRVSQSKEPHRKQPR